MSSRFYDAINVDLPIETKQREVGTQHVVQRSTVAQPQMRRTAPRHCGLSEVVHRVRRRDLTVVGDDRRSFVEISKVESTAAELTDIDVKGFTPDPSAHRVPFWACLVNDGGYSGALRSSRQRRVHCVA